MNFYDKFDLKLLEKILFKVPNIEQYLNIN